MFFDDLMNPDPDDSKVIQAEIDLFEEKGTGTLAVQKPNSKKTLSEEQKVAKIDLLEMNEDSQSSINDYSTFSRPIGKIGVFVQDLFFFKKESERVKI